MIHVRTGMLRLSLIFSCVLVSCQDDSEVIAPQSVESDFGTYNISTFVPMRIGTRWIYDVATTAEHAVLDRRIQDTVGNADGLLLLGYSEAILQNVNPPSLSLDISGTAAERSTTVSSTVELQCQNSQCSRPPLLWVIFGGLTQGGPGTHSR
jgi:hypothetical protein